MKLTPLHKVFEIEYPKTLVLTEQILDPNGTIFISSKGTNNGVSARVAEIDGHKKYRAGAITVALKGSVMSAFLQVEDFYIAHQNAVLYPKTEMSNEAKLFYCICLAANKYKFNYGRQADRTLKEILVPETIPIAFQSINFDKIISPNTSSLISGVAKLNISDWQSFNLEKLFEIKKGKRLTKEDMEDGSTPFIGAIDSNNGWREFVGHPPIHQSNTITVNYNGNGVAEGFYQPLSFWASDDVNVLYPKFEMNVFTALFIITVIRQEKYRFNYGRKWHKERMEKSMISLPAKNGKPDYQFMERYIKCLPYSSALLINKKELREMPQKNKKIKEELSDDDLIKKYESGPAPIKKIMKAMLQTPNPSQSKKK